MTARRISGARIKTTVNAKPPSRRVVGQLVAGESGVAGGADGEAGGTIQKRRGLLGHSAQELFRIQWSMGYTCFLDFLCPSNLKVYQTLLLQIPRSRSEIDYGFTLRYQGDSAKRGRGDARPDSSST